jgi:hypothetical protein
MGDGKAARSELAFKAAASAAACILYCCMRSSGEIEPIDLGGRVCCAEGAPCGRATQIELQIFYRRLMRESVLRLEWPKSLGGRRRALISQGGSRSFITLPPAIS